MRQGAKGNLPPPNQKHGERYYIGKGAFVDTPSKSRRQYFQALLACIERTQVTGNLIDEVFRLEPGLKRLDGILRSAHRAGGKAIFIGNGGSAAIASHMAVDWSKNKGIRSVALNDAAMLTMLGNDFGYDQVFAKQIEYHGRQDDVAVIISSSGRSLNILAAASAARTQGLRAVITFSGMNPNNALRRRGNLNFYVPSVSYGLVELSHLSLLHSLVPS